MHITSSENVPISKFEILFCTEGVQALYYHKVEKEILEYMNHVSVNIFVRACCHSMQLE